MPAQIIAGDIREHDPVEFKTALQQAGVSQIDTAALYKVRCRRMWPADRRTLLIKTFISLEWRVREEDWELRTI